MKGPPPLRRVVYVVSLFPCWSETFIVREIGALVASGVDVRIISLKHPSEQLVHDDAAALLGRVHHPRPLAATLATFVATAARRPVTMAAIVLRILADSWRSPRVLWRSLAALLRGVGHVGWLRGFEPDLIHAHWATYPSTVAWALGRLLDRPFGFTCHAHDIFTERQLLLRKIREAALAVTISHYNVDWLRRHVAGEAAGRLEVVHCGVDMHATPWEPDGRDPDLILAVGRLDPIKGFDTLLEALARLQARGVDARCRLVGSGPLEGALRAHAARLGLEGRIEFAGAQAQDVVRRWMREAAVFALPSCVAADGNRDGIPVALMEAMASGCATVGTRVSGIPELIEDGVGGLLVEPGDAGALADALERLLADAPLRRRLAAGARARVEEQFDAAKEALRLRGHMQEALHVA